MFCCISLHGVSHYDSMSRCRQLKGHLTKIALQNSHFLCVCILAFERLEPS